MTERRMLEIGIRAIGILFLLWSLGDFLLYFGAPLYMNFQWGTWYAITALARVLVALGIVRFAPSIASRLSEAIGTEDAPDFDQKPWNHWLLATTALFALSSTWAESLSTLARKAILIATESIANSSGLFVDFAIVFIECLLLVLIVYTMLRKPRWIAGRDSHGVY